uniref:Uncharacterized protein n=1 Tax=Oryza sativa subsp. japonica TaxID=39947 RepID=Q6ZG41_ORYSJ|nr:hypothetical protein [Oryza sativa Japonica Group]
MPRLRRPCRACAAQPRCPAAPVAALSLGPASQRTASAMAEGQPRRASPSSAPFDRARDAPFLPLEAPSRAHKIRPPPLVRFPFARPSSLQAAAPLSPCPARRRRSSSRVSEEPARARTRDVDSGRTVSLLFPGPRPERSRPAPSTIVTAPLHPAR